MKLFVFALAARRIIEQQYEVGIRTAVVLNQTETEALQEAWQTALNAFPETDGWHEHEIVPQEIPQELAFDDGHLLRWQSETRPFINHAAIALLRSWREEDPEQQRAVWDTLKQTLDEDRLSDREHVP